MKNIVDLLSQNSMKDARIAAGIAGIRRPIQKLDILDTPYPDVVKFLEKNEFMFTTFWNSKQEKLHRILLIEEMIRKKSAGIAIMPALYLDNKIDDEIIELGNENDFPVIYVSSNTRWSDVIREFYESKYKEDLSFYKEVSFSKIVQTFDVFKKDQSIEILLDEISQIIKAPILYRDTDLHLVNTKYPKSIVRKATGYMFQNEPVCVNSRGSVKSVQYLNDGQYLVTYSINKIRLGVILTELDLLNEFKTEILKSTIEIIANTVRHEHKKSRSIKSQSYIEVGSYLLMISPAIQLNGKSHRQNLTLHEINELHNEAIYITNAISKDSPNLADSIKCLFQNSNAKLLIYSQLPNDETTINKSIEFIRYLKLRDLGLEGIYSLGELLIMTLLNYAPIDLLDRINDYFPVFLNEDDEIASFETFRLFLILKNINQVATILDVHPNTVKYRILKLVNQDLYYSNNLSNDIWSLDFLVYLEGLSGKFL